MIWGVSVKALDNKLRGERTSPERGQQHPIGCWLRWVNLGRVSLSFPLSLPKAVEKADYGLGLLSL